MYPTIDPGTLRHPITIWRKGTASIGAAGAKHAREQVAAAQASIAPMRGTDVIKAGQTVTQLPVVIRMWFQPGILANMEVDTAAGSTYVIQAIENMLEMNVVLVLHCIALGSNQ